MDWQVVLVGEWLCRHLPCGKSQFESRLCQEQNEQRQWKYLNKSMERKGCFRLHTHILLTYSECCLEVVVVLTLCDWSRTGSDMEMTQNHKQNRSRSFGNGPRKEKSNAGCSSDGLSSYCCWFFVEQHLPFAPRASIPPGVWNDSATCLVILHCAYLTSSHRTIECRHITCPQASLK